MKRKKTCPDTCTSRKSMLEVISFKRSLYMMLPHLRPMHPYSSQMHHDKQKGNSLLVNTSCSYSYQPSALWLNGSLPNTFYIYLLNTLYFPLSVYVCTHNMHTDITELVLGSSLYQTFSLKIKRWRNLFPWNVYICMHICKGTCMDFFLWTFNFFFLRYQNPWVLSCSLI
jgi:hypothetical protein